MRSVLTTMWLFCAAAATGCANPEFRFPQPFRQGTAYDQRIGAQHFDPYPTDAGGGDTTGGRPEDYHEQIPEPARSRWTLPKFLTRRPVPPPMVAPQGGGPALVPPSGVPVQGYPPGGYPAAGYPSTGYPAAAEAPAYSQGSSAAGGFAPASGS